MDRVLALQSMGDRMVGLHDDAVAKRDAAYASGDVDLAVTLDTLRGRLADAVNELAGYRAV